MFDKELRVFFDPAVYSVPEGENQVLVLRTDNEFAVPFTIDVTLRDGTAVGKYMNYILPCTVHISVLLKHSCAVGRRFQPNWYYHGVRGVSNTPFTCAPKPGQTRVRPGYPNSVHMWP